MIKHHFYTRYQLIPTSEPQVANNVSDEQGKSRRSDKMLQAMDDLLEFSILIKRTTGLKAAERQKHKEAAVMGADEDGQMKVRQWLNSL
jgi:hypothetical protein